MIGHKFIATVWLILLCSCAGGDGLSPQAVDNTSTPAGKSPAPPATLPSGAGEQWIEVVLDRQTVILHDGDSIAGEFMIAAGVGTSPETTTYPGEFKVQTLMPGQSKAPPACTSQMWLSSTGSTATGFIRGRWIRTETS